MRDFKPLAIMGAACLFLGACDAIIVEERVGPGWSYYNGDLTYATRNGNIVTHVAGNPFGGDQTAFAAAVRKMMYGQTAGRPFEFVAQADEKSATPYNVVLAFNAPANIDGHDLCASGNKTATTPAGATLRAAIAFCEGDHLKSDAFARAGNITGLNDERFRSLVEQITRSMVPPDGADDTGGDSNIN